MQARADEIVSGPGPAKAVKPGSRTLPHALAVGAAFFSAVVILQASCDEPKTQPAPERQSAVTLDPAAVVGLLNSAFTAEGVRNKPRYPMEFDAILGPATMASLDLFASASWPSQGPIQVAAAQPGTPRRIALAQGCAAGCKPKPASDTKLADARAVLPPARPALVMAVADAAPAQPRSFAEERRLQFLGVKLPGFVPSGRAIVSTVVSWGGTVVDLVPRI